MIGTLLVETPHRQMRAELDDDFSWLADDQELRDLLQQISPPPLAVADHDVATGRYMLYRAGARLGARVQVNGR